MEVARARPLDFLETVGDDGRAQLVNRRSFGLWARQVSGSEALTWRDDAGELVAITGMWPLGDRQWEAWFAAGPALRRCLIPFVWDFRADLAVLGRFMPGATITAYIHPSSVAGPRIAKLLGFQPCGLTSSPLGDLATYRRTLT